MLVTINYNTSNYSLPNPPSPFCISIKISGETDRIIIIIQCQKPKATKSKILATGGIIVIKDIITAPIIVVPSNNLFPVKPTLKIDK